MCWVLYMASDAEIPLVPWHEETPAFHVSALSEADEVVRKHFTLPNVAYLGSQEGCGCGFKFDADLDLAEQTQELRALDELASFLSAVLKRGGSVELFLAWEGELGAAVGSNIELHPENFIASEFPMKEQQIARVSL